MVWPSGRAPRRRFSSRVYQSFEHARNFGERLKPILQKHKIELSSEPRPQLVKNTIKGKSL
jgi:hypothetical protein